MGEANRRKSVGNIVTDKQWHKYKAARKRAKKISSAERAENRARMAATLAK